MKKYTKSKRGFTLVEMMLVVAIIVVLAGVVTLTIGDAIARSNNRTSQVSAHNGTIDQASRNVKGILAGEPTPHLPATPTETSLRDSHHGSYDF